MSCYYLSIIEILQLYAYETYQVLHVLWKAGNRLQRSELCRPHPARATATVQ